MSKKIVNEVTAMDYFNITKLIQQYDRDNTLHFTYDRDGEVICFTHFCLSTGVDDLVMAEYFLLDICIS